MLRLLAQPQAGANTFHLWLVGLVTVCGARVGKRVSAVALSGGYQCLSDDVVTVLSDLAGGFQRIQAAQRAAADFAACRLAAGW